MVKSFHILDYPTYLHRFKNLIKLLKSIVINNKFKGIFMENIQISIIIPNFNGKQFLKEC